MNKSLFVLLFLVALIPAAFILSSKFSLVKPATQDKSGAVLGEAESQEKFNYLSTNGNSSCSAAFSQSIATMEQEARLRGSCCSQMSMHRYSEQVEGLKKYSSIPQIPIDPYDIEAGLAKKLMSYYDMQLTTEEHIAFDYAMQNSSEKGPCCCKCWRWYVYGGLGKYLVRNHGFTGEQVTEVWNLSDGCGGDSEHQHTS